MPRYSYSEWVGGKSRSNFFGAAYAQLMEHTIEWENNVKYKKWLEIILALLIVAQMAFIFAMSQQSGHQSHEISAAFARVVARVTTPDFDGLPGHEQDRLVEHHQHMTRKAAHVTEFAVLAGLITLLLHRLKRWQGPLIALGAAGAYALFDEWHQLSIAGRSGAMQDVMIDCMGAALGVVCAMVLLYAFRRVTDKKR